MSSERNPSEGFPRKIHDRELQYENPFQQVFRVQVDFADSSKQIFVNDHGKRAGIVVVRNSEILLVRQYRLLIDNISLELPGGSIDPGETAADAAIREVHEESGVRCDQIEPLVYFHPGLDTCDNPTYLFTCEAFVESSPPRSDIREVVSHEWFPIEDCLRMIFEGTIVDSLTICGILAYETRKKRDRSDGPSKPFEDL